MSFQIQFATTEAERETIYRLRYQIYVEELGAVTFPGVDHGRRLLGEGDVRNSRLLYAVADGKVVATLRLQLGGDDALSEEDAIVYELARFAGQVELDHVCILSRFMALPEHRGGPLPQLLLREMYRFCVAQGVALCLLDCRPHLLNLYQRLGFRTYARPYSEPGYGLLIPMALLINDRTHLERIGSPLLADAPASSGCPAAALAALLHDDEAAVVPADALAAEEAPSYGQSLIGEGLTPVALFGGFSQTEVARVVARGHIVTCRRGDKLIIDGDTSVCDDTATGEAHSSFAAIPSGSL